VAGVDSSTRSTKVELRDLATGALVASGRSAHPQTHPPVSEQHPDDDLSDDDHLSAAASVTSLSASV
jgi:xylulokinase